MFTNKTLNKISSLDFSIKSLHLIFILNKCEIFVGYHSLDFVRNDLK
ncbi:hypothetical protein EV195_104202 [Tenacibaculum skagerrakense]|uniref:Uncharacterized protein n=1 Tax=Tenacibaculum skagerrakense TaxID=186571 RepID=A0A4R2NT36_9FLAO|nr:hypothetical protein EV195_104202 [Tenacibaculum skagerrakense]